MNARLLIPAFAVLISACQTSLPFYGKTAVEPDWFKEKAAQADAKGYPATRAVPPRPKDVTPPAKRDATLSDLEKAGNLVREHPRAELLADKKKDPEAFAKKAQAETVVPPLVDEEERPN
ncbi:MAG: hypothetical protein COA84_06685 [Robiginitomaculum sp.]|nr:MAG: hypothetical protein COA84_06685 [Robiginitomaculum sp.]